MKEQKVYVELSKVYDNNRTTFEGLCIGERGVFSNDENFDDYIISNLVGLETTCNCPYVAADKDAYRKYYKYYIPLNRAAFKEVDVRSSYRKFKSIDEFEYVTQNYFNIGDSVIIRNKKTLNESELVYGGYFVNEQSEVLICLGAFIFTLEELFKDYEFHINDDLEEWAPFGVEE